MYADTITLFNRKSGDRGQGDTWYPTIIKCANLNVDRAAIMAKYGENSQDAAYLGIHYQDENGDIIVAGKPWMSPKKWDKTDDSITFNNGNDFDFFWMGKWEGGIVTDADYPHEGFYNFMNRTEDYVFAISKVAIHTAIPLIEIWGK